MLLLTIKGWWFSGLFLWILTNREERAERKGGDNLSAPSCFHSGRNNIQVFKEVSEIPFNFACWMAENFPVTCERHVSA